ALKHKLALDSGRLGIVIFTVSAVATLSLPFAGWIASRRGSRSPACVGLVLASGALAAAAFAPSLAFLSLVACGLGGGIGVADVALNAHGVELERRMRRPLLSPLHAAWSFGLLGGSAVTAVAAAVGLGLKAELPAVGAALALLALASAPRLLGGTAADVATSHFALPRGVLALPALLMFCAFFVESASMNWSAVFLSGPAGASAAVAAGAVVAYAAAMGAARLVRDHLRRHAARDHDALAGPGPRRLRTCRRRLRCDRARAVPDRRIGGRHLTERRRRRRRDGRLHRRAPQRSDHRLPRARRRAERGARSPRRRRCPHRGARSTIRVSRMKVGVVGLGTMGAGIAQLCVEAGIDTVGREVTADLGERARDRIGHFLTRKVEKGQLQQDVRDDAMKRLTLTTELTGLADCDVVIEAIVEELAPKQDLFAELERICRSDTVLATNTSAL